MIRHLESFLLELGAGFAFVARQKRIRIGHVWYRIDLLLYHRGLRCLVVIDLKNGHFTHADAGQMNLYLNYVREHLTMPGEVGLTIARQMLEAHGGSIDILLDGRRKGANFLVTLPRKRSRATIYDKNGVGGGTP